MSTNESASDEVEYSAVPGSAVYAAAVVTAEEETLILQGTALFSMELSLKK